MKYFFTLIKILFPIYVIVYIAFYNYIVNHIEKPYLIIGIVLALIGYIGDNDLLVIKKLINKFKKK